MMPPIVTVWVIFLSAGDANPNVWIGEVMLDADTIGPLTSEELKVQKCDIPDPLLTGWNATLQPLIVKVKSASGSQGCATAFDVIPARRKHTIIRIAFLVWGKILAVTS